MWRPNPSTYAMVVRLVPSMWAPRSFLPSSSAISRATPGRWFQFFPPEPMGKTIRLQEMVASRVQRRRRKFHIEGQGNEVCRVDDDVCNEVCRVFHSLANAGHNLSQPSALGPPHATICCKDGVRTHLRGNSKTTPCESSMHASCTELLEVKSQVAC